MPPSLIYHPSSRDEEELELASLIPSDDDENDVLISIPDDPLAMTPPPPSSSSQSTTTFRLPKWLSQQANRPRAPWHRRWLPVISSYVVRIVRPRFTWRYILCASAALYTAYCLIRNEPLFASRLPDYTGPYGVGAVDLEVPLADGPHRVSDAVFKGSGEPAFDVESLLVTLYYPTDPSFRSSKPRYPWIPKPISLTAEGFARLVHMDNFIMRPIFTFFLWGIASSLTIPAEVDAPLLGTTTVTTTTTTTTTASIAALEKQDRFPVMVFSHGMASSRTDYTNFLGELASRGHVVAAIEHRDGSSPGSLIKLHPSDPGRRRLIIRQSDLEPHMDTPEFKRTQLAFRDTEILAAINLLTFINDPAGTPLNNTRDPVTTLSTWPGRLNLDLLTIAGHSYGATGALQSLATVAPQASSGLILDPGKSSGPLNPNATAPLLVIHSNSWSRAASPFHGRPHFDTVRDLVRNAHAPSWFLTSVGTAHPSVTDAPLIEPLLLCWTTGAGMDVKRALREYVDASQDFLNYVATGEVTGLLVEEVTHEEYGVWVSEEREADFPRAMAKHWEIHVRPDI
ncbi:Platelet-activating factor acetylhydrolase 2, cytoplasmic-like protein [Hapsidospora chrysogenum ATCC 11550]|uniref:Putative phospholipase n=1 Tax=Hapsidospora chrysogenum (strain ATCC 11550 / CBS 779.69 / DSM 880 / IAM 14645 / JCM 23072 / IMI 49137) TaxID=857340 RepID=A0A086T8J5_HAPC1|nr:Platelet-activating factor acetylhydrolase 2, cytoplasmic-like protein [Hapsidospora chrysogenum ATCC 11550]